MMSRVRFLARETMYVGAAASVIVAMVLFLARTFLAWSHFDCYIDGVPTTECQIVIDDKIVGDTPNIRRVHAGFRQISICAVAEKDLKTHCADWRGYVGFFGKQGFKARFETIPPDPQVLVTCSYVKNEKVRVGDCQVADGDVEVGYTPLYIIVEDGIQKTYSIYPPDNLKTNQRVKSFTLSQEMVDEGVLDVQFR